jgi:CubicO group peptidase (beta-lactamase class C family)
MGAEADASWLIDKGGYEAAFTGINATLRDYGRFGLMLANDGAVGGTPGDSPRPGFVPRPRRLRRNSSPGRVPGLFGYGYQTWVLGGQRRQFTLRGVRGQFVFVDPASKVVLVHTVRGRDRPAGGELVRLWTRVVEVAR